MVTVLVAHPSAELYGCDRMLLETVSGLLAGAPASEVVVTLPASGALLAPLTSLGARVELRPVPVLRKAFASPRGLLRLLARSAWTLPGAMAAVRRHGADVVYVNTVTIPLWILAGWLSRRRVVVHVHEAEDGLPRAVTRLINLPLTLAALVIANSAASRDVLISACPWLAGRTVVVHNGVAGPTTPATLPGRDAPNPVRLLLVGRLSPRKGTDTAIQALAILCERGIDARLTLAGDVFPGYEWFNQSLNEQIEELGLVDRVRFAGFVPNVWTLHEHADLVLMPSRSEPFGNAAVEAMLAGRPLIAAATQGLLEIVDHRRTGLLVAPDDPAALAAAVITCLEDWAATRARAEAAHGDVVRRFSVPGYRATIRDAVLDAVGDAQKGSR